MYNLITYATADRVATITINRPDKRNALNYALVGELTDALNAAAAANDVKAIQLRAEGKVFSAGADLDYLQRLQDNSYQENLDDSRHLATLFRTVVALPKPVIACVQGAAVAGGCGLVTVCDFSIAVEDAQFGYTESRIGFVPALVMVFLLRKIGDTRARDLMLTGRLIAASEAERMGLITRAVPIGAFEQAIHELTETLLNDASGESMALIKNMAMLVPTMGLDEALEYAAETNAAARSSADCRRGIGAFLAKEKIRW